MTHLQIKGIDRSENEHELRICYALGTVSGIDIDDLIKFSQQPTQESVFFSILHKRKLRQQKLGKKKKDKKEPKNLPIIM